MAFHPLRRLGVYEVTPTLVFLITLIILGSRSTAAQSQGLIQLQSGNASQLIFLSINRPPNSSDNQLTLILGSMAPECLFPRVFEVPVQLGEASFQLKRMVRLIQQPVSRGCSETLVAVYRPADAYYLTAASSVVMHLPTGPLRWSMEAIDYARSMKPAESAPYQVLVDDFYTVPAQLITMAAAGQANEARSKAEAIAPLYVSRPPGESLAFFAALGMARRATNDLPAAATAYEVASMIAEASKDSSEFVGAVYDNLATVRRLQGQFAGATTASDRALAILSATGSNRQMYGGALNNRALLLSDEGRAAAALEYSERALVILRESLKNDPAALAPFLEDNRLFRENAEGR